MFLFFEGSEKKAEIVVKATQISLLDDIEDDFWPVLVQCCNAQILSSIRNHDCKAFLLSESSLFVWHDRILILTCGNTRLVHSVEFFIQQIGMDNIQQVIYQRKNEYFAHAQPSSFGDDIKLLGQYVAGKAYRFGELDSHHNYIFHQDNNFQADNLDKTYEFLAYQISQQASEKLTTVGLKAEEIRQFLQLDKLIGDFLLDDFVFDPFGYSVNAIKGKHYLTIHVTPQANSSYVSVESNINLRALTEKFLTILAPKSFDLLSFNDFDFVNLTDEFIPTNYVSKSRVSEHLSNNYLVCFANYILPQQGFAKAKAFDIAGENHAL